MNMHPLKGSRCQDGSRLVEVDVEIEGEVQRRGTRAASSLDFFAL
jgi:hypothetical protein